MKKYIFLVSLCLCLILGLLPVTALAAAPSTATIEGVTYYQLSNAQDLVWFAQQVSGGNTTINGRLTADVDLSGIQWTPIGNLSNHFAGCFDGNGYTVSNLTYEMPDQSYIGMFGVTKTGSIVRRLTVKNVKITGADSVGGLVGSCRGTLEDCYIDGTVTGGYDIGGVAGRSAGLIQRCGSGCAVQLVEVEGMSWSNMEAGGVVGALGRYGQLLSCYSIGSVSGYAHLGGIVGYSVNSDIQNCYSAATLNGELSVGGILAVDDQNRSITDCYYLEGTAECGNPYQADKLGGCMAFSREALTSGELCHLLNSNDPKNPLWFQTVGEDAPAHTGKPLYYGYWNCVSDQPEYSNETVLITASGSHTFRNGICSVCWERGYEEPELDQGFYRIANAGQLIWFFRGVEDGTIASKKATLVEDITIDSTVNWTSPSVEYITLQGNGHTIHMELSGNRGLLDTLNYSLVENLTLTGYLSTDSGSDVGALAASAYRTTLRGITSYVNVYNKGTTGGTGGLVGIFGGQNADGLYTLIENCGVLADITGGGSAGGFVGNGWNGYQFFTIRSSFFQGSVSGAVNSGAILGYNGNNSSTVSYLDRVYYLELNGRELVGDPGSGQLDITDVLPKTEAEFNSGEVAYLLGEPWGQSVELETHPKLGGSKVYEVLFCDGTTIYRNSDENIQHHYINGFCTNCLGYQSAPLEEGTYRIANAGQLYWFAAVVNEGYRDTPHDPSARGVLTRDITVNDGIMNAQTEGARKWTPIGTPSSPFTGEFNGNGLQVSGLFYNSPSSNYVGIIGYLGEGGRIQDVTLKNSYFSGRSSVAGIAGCSYGTVLRCLTDSQIIGRGGNIGGIVGFNGGRIQDCVVSGTVTGGNSYVGGITGYHYDASALRCFSLVENLPAVGNVASGKVSSCYYLADADDGLGGKTEAQFASGEVAYLLGGTWGQTVGEEPVPVLGGAKIYQLKACTDQVTYSNLNLSVVHRYVEGFCQDCGHAMERPVLTLKYPTLIFEEEIRYRIYYSVSTMEHVVEMGLVVFPSKLREGTIADAIDVIPGSETGSGLHVVSSRGISAKALGADFCFKVYAKLTDGTYEYSKAASYNAVTYARSVLKGNASPESKALVVAMLNYGAAAQQYFYYQTDDLVNSWLSPEQKALAPDYRDGMAGSLTQVAPEKAGIFQTREGAFLSQYPSVVFDGAFSINYYLIPGKKVESGMTLYYWKQSTVDGVKELTMENADGMLPMLPSGGRYVAQISGIAAKQIHESIHVAAVYESGGERFTSGILTYSLGRYFKTQAANNQSDAQNLAKAAAVYGFCAKLYFA